jgi:hypothetical protein
MIIYKNKWCKIEQKDTLYILKSLKNKYNDSYFLSLPQVCAYIGINVQDVINYSKKDVQS